MTPSPSQTPTSNPETVRETRRRLMLGFGGLMLMLLLVILAGFLTAPARREAEAARAQAAAAGVANPGTGTTGTNPMTNEPLGDGSSSPAITTGRVPTPSGAVVPATGKDGTVIVPDLEPDPNLDRSTQQ
jgi:predicted lipid-binding transport protein (Tim44 family)